jgi:MFS family permease
MRTHVAGHHSLLHHRDFLALWAGETVSLFGSQVTLLALPLTAVLTLHASVVQMAVLGAAGRLPNLLVNLPSGVWIDRLRRRPVMVASDLGQAILLATIPLAALLGVLTLGQLDIVAFLVSSLAVVFGNAYAAYLPSLIEPHQLIDGNSKLEASRSLSQIAGPGIAGILVQSLTAPIAILADAGSFLAGALSLVLVRRTEPPVDREGRREGMWQEARAGVRFVVHHVVIGATMAAVGAANLFLSAGGTVELLYLTHQLHFGPTVIGLLFALFGPGGLAGILLAPRVGRRLGLGPAIIVGGVAYGIGALALPLASGSAREIVVVVAAGQIVMGLSAPSYYINFRVIQQAMTPAKLRGRVFATSGMVALGTLPIGALLGGFVGQAIGLRPTLLMVGFGVSAAFGLLALTPVTRLETLPVGNRDQAGHAQQIEEQNQYGVEPQAQILTLRTEDETPQVDHGEENTQAGEIDVGLVGGGKDSLTGEQRGEQKQDGQKGVASKDIAES